MLSRRYLNDFNGLHRHSGPERWFLCLACTEILPAAAGSIRNIRLAAASKCADGVAQGNLQAHARPHLPMAAAEAPACVLKTLGSHDDNPPAYAPFNLIARDGIGFGHLGHVGGGARRVNRARPSPSPERRSEERKAAPAEERTAADATQGPARTAKAAPGRTQGAPTDTTPAQGAPPPARATAPRTT